MQKLKKRECDEHSLFSNNKHLPILTINLLQIPTIYFKITKVID